MSELSKLFLKVTEDTVAKRMKIHSRARVIEFLKPSNPGTQCHLFTYGINKQLTEAQESELSNIIDLLGNSYFITVKHRINFNDIEVTLRMDTPDWKSKVKSKVMSVDSFAIADLYEIIIDLKSKITRL